jgi:hypothetical protein
LQFLRTGTALAGRTNSGGPGKIVPAKLPDRIEHPKAMPAMMKMKKRDIAELERAAQS